MSTTTWIIVIIFVIVIIIIIVGVVLYFFVFSKPKPPTTTGGGGGGGGGSGGGTVPTNAVKFGDTIPVFNIDSTFGGYLFICGPSGSGCNANCATSNNIAGFGESPLWTITSTTNIANGTPVQYGQNFTLRGSTNNSYLGYCGNTNNICGTNIGTRLQTNNTTTWKFDKLTSTNTNNTNFILKNTNLIIVNNDTDNNKLTVCGNAGSVCGMHANVTNSNNNPASSASLYTWQIK